MIEFSIPSVLRERASLQLNEKAFTFVDYGQDWDGVAENLNSNEEVMHKLGVIKSEVTSPISKSHGLSGADLVVVPPGSIPITTSGKVRRQTCVDHYRQDQFARLDA